MSRCDPAVHFTREGLYFTGTVQPLSVKFFYKAKTESRFNVETDLKE